MCFEMYSKDDFEKDTKAECEFCKDGIIKDVRSFYDVEDGTVYELCHKHRVELTKRYKEELEAV